MSSVPVYTGFWIDSSYSGAYSWSLTWTEENGRYLISGISIFIASLVGAFFWTGVAAYGIHQCSVPSGDKPAAAALRYQHQVAFRNSQSALGTLSDFFCICVGMYPCRIRKKPRPPRPPRGNFWGVFLRTALVMLWTFAIWGVFMASSVLSARVAQSDPAFAHNSVLVQPTSGKCGLWVFNGTSHQQQQLAYNTKVLRDTISARAYARSCYAADLGTPNTIPCTFFTKPSLGYSARSLERSCPFGLAGTVANMDLPYAGSECDTLSNSGSYFMFTDMLDSHFDLGINAPPSDRIQLQKNTTCSPLVIHFAASSGEFGGGNYTAYDYGSSVGLTSASANLSSSDLPPNTTFIYSPQAKYDNVGYQITAVYSLAGSPSSLSGWQPGANFSRSDGDTSLIFFAANSVRYFSQTLDPFFLARYSIDETASARYFTPSNQVSVLGCVDQYILRNPAGNTSRQTPPSGQFALNSTLGSLGFNAAQRVTARRLLAALVTADIYSSVFGSGPAALKASDKVLNFAAGAIPYGQWQVEVEGWFQTGLAKLQQAAVDYAYNTADPGPDAYLAVPTAQDGDEQDAWRHQCMTQRISNTGSYETFWVLGLIIILAVGLLLSGLGLCLRNCVRCCFRGRKGYDVREWSYVADSKFQLQRMVLEKIEEGPYREWNSRDADYPWCVMESHRNSLVATMKEIRPREDCKFDAIYYRPSGAPVKLPPPPSSIAAQAPSFRPEPGRPHPSSRTAPTSPTRPKQPPPGRSPSEIAPASEAIDPSETQAQPESRH